jgi:hypothetical protein
MARVLVLLALIAMSSAIPFSGADIASTVIQTNSSEDMNSPSWLNSAAYGLLCYDVLAMAILCWLWWGGYLKWMTEQPAQRVQRREVDRWGMQRDERLGRQALIESEMRRMGMI